MHTVYLIHSLPRVKTQKLPGISQDSGEFPIPHLITHLHRADNLRFFAQGKDPGKELWAHSDGFSDGEAGFAIFHQHDVVAEMIQYHTDQVVVKPHCHTDDVTLAIHGEDVLGVILQIDLRVDLFHGKTPGVDAYILHTIHTEMTSLSMIIKGKQIVIVIHIDQRIGLHEVRAAAIFMCNSQAIFILKQTDIIINTLSFRRK